MSSALSRLRQVLNHLDVQATPASALPFQTTATSSHEFDYQHNHVSFTNWAQIHSCTPEYYHQPADIAQLRQILLYAAEHNQCVRVIGSAHSPSDIAMTQHHLVNLDFLNKILSIDSERCVVRAQAGIRLHELNSQLAQRGLALRNLGSIDEQSIAGAISTGTHGTGWRYGIIATDVLALKLMTASGDIIDCSESQNPDVFAAARCSLGALGIIVEVTIQCEKLQFLESYQYSLPFEEAMSQMTKIARSAEHVRVWWFPHTDSCLVWQANRTPIRRQPTFSHLKKSITAARDKLIGYHMLEPALYCGTLVPSLVPAINKLWFKLQFARNRKAEDISYKQFTFDCLFKQYVNEWAVPTSRAVEAVRALRSLIESKNYNIHFPIEIRFVKSDNIWLSPAYEGDRCYIGSVMYRPYGKDPERWQEYFTDFESSMNQLDGRPHWAKIHSWTYDECKKSWPMFEAFVQLRERLDPNRLFWNDYMNRIFSQEAPPAQQQQQ